MLSEHKEQFSETSFVHIRYIGEQGLRCARHRWSHPRIASEGARASAPRGREPSRRAAGRRRAPPRAALLPKQTEFGGSVLRRAGDFFQEAASRTSLQEGFAVEVWTCENSWKFGHYKLNFRYLEVKLLQN